MFEFILFVVGLAILVKGADFLVDGASSLASRFKISPIVIGLTVVAFGTSSPELVVSLTSALSGNTDIALGNVIGSNIFNILLILGISAVIFPLVVLKNTTRKEIPFSFLGAILIAVFGLQIAINTGVFDLSVISSPEVVGTIGRTGGIFLLAFFIIFLYYTFGIAKVTGESEIEIKKRSLSIIFLFILLGLLGLTFGSKIAIDNAVAIARMFNLSDAFIGLTLVSAGTSFPELFTNIAAVRKKNTDIAVGNIVGSNIFNIFLILGVTSLVKDIPIRGIQLVDIAVLIGATLILLISIFIWKKHSIGRREGIFMLLLYIVYIAFLLIRG